MIAEFRQVDRQCVDAAYPEEHARSSLDCQCYETGRTYGKMDSTSLGLAQVSQNRFVSVIIELCLVMHKNLTNP